jgi:hypothetical protein
MDNVNTERRMKKKAPRKLPKRCGTIDTDPYVKYIQGTKLASPAHSPHNDAETSERRRGEQPISHDAVGRKSPAFPLSLTFRFASLPSD